MRTEAGRGKSPAKVALVTGGTSGIGLETAKALCGRGVKVYTLSRRRAEIPGVTSLTADVTDEDAVKKAVSELLLEAGRIDILVNCAGFGISGAVEFTELSEAKKQFDVNFFGTVNVTKAVLPRMRKRGAGRIVCVSSVAAPAAIPFQAYYSAAKAALNTWCFALSSEVRPYGISVTAVQPGDIRTGFTAAREKSDAGDEEYGGRISRSVAKMEHDEQHGMDPAKAGAVIAKAALSRSVPSVSTIGFGYKTVTLLSRLLPPTLFNRVVGMLYAK